MLFPKAFVALAAGLFFAAPTLAQDIDLELLDEVDAPSSSTRNREAKTSILPKTYIVQLKAEENGLTRRSDESHAKFHRLSKKAELDFSTRQTYSDSALFVGLSLTLADDSDLQTLKDLDNVIGVWPVVSIHRPLAAIPAGMGSLKARAPVPGTNITQPYIVGETDVNSPHAMAKVDQLHARGIKGKGIKLAIIDSGVDYRHPALGGGFGPGYKFEYGYDFIENNADPLVTCIDGGHGTHVAGIIGAVDTPGSGFGQIGVAPEATLGMYRVFDCIGNADGDVLISAMLKAAEDGADLVSMSLGAITAVEENDPWAQVTSALVEQGVAVFASAGNSGASGVYQTSAPGIGKDVFSVGSTDNTKFPVTYELSDNTGRTLRYSAITPLDGPEAGLTVQILNFGASSALLQGCSTTYYQNAALNLTRQGLDPANFILLVKNGGCSSLSKANTAARFGYKFFLSYTTPDLSFALQGYAAVSPATPVTIQPIVISPQDTVTVLGSYTKKPGEYKLFFSATNYVAKSGELVTGGFMSNFSSIGPTYALNLKPQLSAPGGQILSTWPLDFYGGYAIISGTSMSCPFMAASYALLRSQLPDLSIHELYALMQNSGDQLQYFYNKNIVASAAQQGAGALNIEHALSWQSLVTPPQFNLGFSPEPVTRNFTIKNRSTREKTYTFAHLPAGGMQYAENFTWEYNMQYPWYADATFSAESVRVQGGQELVVSFTITPPQNPVNIELWPFYTGYVIVKNNYETYSLPYLGSQFVEP